MTNRLTDEQLDTIQKRAQAATEGSWKYDMKYGYLAPVTPQRQIATICNEITRDADAEFIANARTDIPSLLDEIKHLRKENHMYEQAVAEDDATKERLLNEVERLQKDKRLLSQKYVNTFISYCEMLDEYLPEWRTVCEDQLKQLREVVFEWK